MDLIRIRAVSKSRPWFVCSINTKLYCFTDFVMSKELCTAFFIKNYVRFSFVFIVHHWPCLLQIVIYFFDQLNLLFIIINCILLQSVDFIIRCFIHTNCTNFNEYEWEMNKTQKSANEWTKKTVLPDEMKTNIWWNNATFIQSINNRKIWFCILIPRSY